MMAARVPEWCQPREGDIVISPAPDSPASWIVRRHTGPAEIIARTRKNAIALADSVATELAVDVWCLEHGAYRMLESHRQAEGMAQPAKAVRRA